MGLTVRDRRQISRQLQEAFDKEVERLTEKLFEKGSRTRDWQRGMKRLITNHAIQQASIGKGAMLNADELNALNLTIKEQQAFLSRFSDKVGLKRMRHESLTIEGVAYQGKQYKSTGIAEFTRAFESQQGGDGVVYDFVSRDAPSTCTPCLVAQEESPYLPGEGKFPFTACKGGSKCHCQRIARYAPEEFQRLRGFAV